MEDLLRAFLAVAPDSSREDARRCLDEADGVLERAINFYFMKGMESRASPRQEEAPAGTSGARDESPLSRPENLLVLDDCCGSKIWDGIVASCSREAKFVDPAFPPAPQSIDGRRVSKNFGDGHILCGCRAKAKLRTVYKDGPNQGKFFYSCEQRKCNFFAWAGSAMRHTPQALSLKWERCDARGHIFVSSRGFSPSDVLQGAVGDCWFLSGLAVIAEREDLISRLFPIVPKPKHPSEDHFPQGCFQVRLFLDGAWTSIVVDDTLPVNAKGKLAFAKPGPKNEVWVPLVEKAYAKAHSSYSAISGGFVSEAMFDLTSLPVEVIEISCPSFDSELTWARLLSFCSLKFPTACSTQGDATLKETGLVGCHAYSLLKVVEISDAKVGKQLNISDFFRAAGSNQQDQQQAKRPRLGEGSSQGKGSLLRLLKIRNPWGKKEWRGDWSDQSDKWTRALHTQLGGKGEKNDGTFWIDYTDFLCRFSLIEVCHAHKDWFSLSRRLSFTRHRCSVQMLDLTVVDPCWSYLMLLQKSKRGNDSDYWYADLTLMIFKELQDGSYILESVLFGGQNKNIFLEVMLHPGRYTISCFTLGLRPLNCTFKMFSAKPVILCERAFSSFPVSMVHQGIAGEVSKAGTAVHKITSNLVLLRVTGPNTAVFFICLNASDLAAKIELRVELEAGNTCFVERESGSEVAVVPPDSQRIVCFLRPKKLGTHKFSYSWESLGEGGAEGASLDQQGVASIFSPLPLVLQGETKNPVTPKGTEKATASFVSKTYGSAQK